MPAECVLYVGVKLESSLRMPFAEADPARFAVLSLAATDAWAMLAGPEPSASGLDAYERLIGAARPRLLGPPTAAPAAWTQAFAAAEKGGRALIVGDTSLEHNISALCKRMETLF